MLNVAEVTDCSCAVDKLLRRRFCGNDVTGRSTRVLFQIMWHRRSFWGELAWLTPPQGAAPRPSSLSKSKLCVWAWAWEYDHYTFLSKYNFSHHNYHYLHLKSEIKSTLWSYSRNYSVICVAICPWIFANCLAPRCYLVHLRSECNAIPQSIVDGDAHHMTAWDVHALHHSMARATTFWLIAFGYSVVPLLLRIKYCMTQILLREHSRTVLNKRPIIIS